jgi:hypothetical protein
LNVEELADLTEAQLRERANASLSGVEPMSAMERQHHLVEAQFYIDEIERREQAREREEHGSIARRDYKLEIWVIVLIGIEILLSILGLAFGYIENKAQTNVLSELKTSVGTLNESTRKTADNIEKLSKAQGDALDTQKKTLSAMKQQLEVLQEDQKQRAAELARRPILELRSGKVRLTSFGTVPIFPKEISQTDAKYEFLLQNIGDLSAKNFNVYMSTDNKDVNISTENGSQSVPIPSDTPGVDHGVSFNVPFLSVNGIFVVRLNLNFPAGTKPFNIHAWANGDNLANQNLGDFFVRPTIFPHH